MKWEDLGALFTPTEKTKLAGIAAAATKYPDTGEQAFLDADHTKLNGVEASADVTDTTNVLAAGCVNAIATWVEHDDMWVNQAVGTIPANSFIIRTYIHVTTLFNDTGGDNIKIGTAATPEGLGTAEDVSTTGLKDPTRGSNIGYNSASQSIVALYEAGNLTATTGKALIVVEYYTVPAQP